MVDEVKIENVGGTRPQLGVASEATLQALLDATRGTQRSDRDRQRIQDSYDRAVRDSTSRQGIFSKAIKSGAEAVYNFGKELALGGDRASDFADAIFGSSSMVSKLTRYLDENIDTWRSLSSVGASFNNSILDMISSAANSAMNIDSFTSMVRNNSQALSRFGETTSQGARFLGEFSKDFRAGVGTQFLEMGFTIEDVNEGLIGFMDIERMRSTQALRSDREQQEAAAQYLLSLDKLTRVTGRQRKQIEDALAQQMQDAGIRSQINRLEGQARSNLQETLAFLDTELQGPLADGLKDLMDGVAQTDLGKALASQVPGITEFAQRMFRGGASLDEVISELGTNFGPQLQKLASSFDKTQLDAMRMSGGIGGAIAEILDSSYLLNQQVGKDVQAAREEQKRREPLTSALAKFEDAIIKIRKAFVDAFFDIVSVPGGLVDALKDLGDFLLSWIEPGANSLTGFVPTLRSWLDIIFGPSGFFTRGVKRFTAWLKEGGLETAWNGLKETFNNVRTWFETFINDVQTDGFIPTITARFTELTDWLKAQWTNVFTDTGNGERWQDRIGNYIRDILYGDEVEVQEGPETRTERQGGLIKTISDGFANLFESAWQKINSILGIETGKTLSQWFNETWTMVSTKFDEIMASINTTLENFKTAIGFGGEKSLTDWFTETWASVKETMTGISTSITSAIDLIRQAFDISEGESLGSWIDKTLAKLTEWKDNQIASLRALIGMEGEESFGQFVTRIQQKIEKQIQDTLDLIENELRSFLGMTGTETFESYISRMISTLTNKILDEINIRIPQLIDTALSSARNYARNTISGVDQQSRDPVEMAKNLLGQGFLNPQEVGGFFSSGLSPELYERLTSDMSFWDRGLTSGNTAQIALEKLLAEAQSGTLTPERQQLLTDIFDSVQTRSLGTLGATGLKVEPKDTIAKIHEGERVLNPIEAANYNNSNNQSDLISKIDELNTTMARVAFLMEASVGVQTKTMQNIKGLGTDLYRGIPR